MLATDLYNCTAADCPTETMDAARPGKATAWSGGLCKGCNGWRATEAGARERSVIGSLGAIERLELGRLGLLEDLAGGARRF